LLLTTPGFILGNDINPELELGLGPKVELGKDPEPVACFLAAEL
jgi:hypothetical protein